MNSFNMELTKRYAGQYKNANKKEKGNILTTYCKLAKCSRNAAKKRLRKEVRMSFYPNVLKKQKNEKRGRKKIYTQIHKDIIEKVWDLSGNICAERIHPEIHSYIAELQKANRLEYLPQEVIKQCKEIKLGTLKKIMRTFPKSSRNKYKGNSDIYKKVSIDANFKRYVRQPGNFEVDYVEHSGGNGHGMFAITGTYVDLFSQWTTRAAALGKHLKSVTEIFEINIKKIYIPILRLHPDNCKSTLKMLTERIAKDKDMKGIVLSRSRPYKKNDNAHVEQKNGDKVRKLVGYFRYDKPEEVDLLNQLYIVEDLITNFFTPSTKLKFKKIDERGRVIKRVYTKATTPYKRLIMSKQISNKDKEKMRIIKKSLSLVELRQRSKDIKRKLARFTT